MRRTLGYHLYACGSKGMPPQISLNGTTYVRRRIFKHDFFAGTAMYESSDSVPGASNEVPRKIVLKLGRQQNLFGMPMRWLGHIITERELLNLRRVRGISGVPRVIAKYGRAGFAYEYIEGRSLDDCSDIPQGFFDKLGQLLDQVHRRNIAYLDMNKRGNILVGQDGEPYLIDFQISMHISDDAMAVLKLMNRILKSLQTCDIYHLFKHKRKLCPKELTPDEKVLSCCVSRFIQLHRRLTRPLTKLRRAFLKMLFVSKFLVRDTDIHYSPENDPARFLK